MELVSDVAIVTCHSRHARRFAVDKPGFSGRMLFSVVLNHCRIVWGGQSSGSSLPVYSWSRNASLESPVTILLRISTADMTKKKDRPTAGVGQGWVVSMRTDHIIGKES